MMDPQSFLSLDPWTMALGLVFSVIGFGYFRYGKRQADMGTLMTGIALMVYPLFVSSVVLMVLIGLLLMAGPTILKRIG